MSNQRLIIGFHAVNARLWQNPASIVELYVQDGRQDARMRDVLAKAAAENVRVVHTDAERLDTLSKKARHQGVVGFIDASKNHVDLDDVLDHLTEPPLLLILDGITDPHNLGACLRVADAMGVHAVIAPKDKSAGLNATVSKVACGAAEVVPYITVTNLARTLRQLKERDIWIVGTDMDGSSDLFHFTAPQAVAWVMGAEGDGMRRLTREHCDMLVSIPMLGSVQSLNVSVSAGMVLAETQRQRSLAT
ncbi:23S rRNA (guanosine(2251)-2'-O)-methyltransferase RlmB [Paralysiella testudinis]|uniref:23S rRNA (guanosine-2'-O-)-methyltransferase RlmB n=1 Tax=Paralysiella testudinis TaxID=2809020 RepID=A0A892ZI20_9NEIS|nr:23S rRNA (guanosine(2251)-2'-O)-methyltransferase RlmB [Paralysiella testudinis]QRQ81184.1 23S rRNA (guanosine(2251)-2'-O)-methyltransferase RlmB [Paralysiella testudinis]